MPRIYKRKLGARKYMDYADDKLNDAIKACKDGMSAREAAEAYGVARATLNRRLKGSVNPYGHPKALSAEEEKMICNYVKVVAEWGYPMSKTDLRHFVRDYIDKKASFS